MVGLAVTLAGIVTGAAPTGGGGFVERIIGTVFDPAWNFEHRILIWAVILAVLFLSGVGLPLPEDIPLTLAGFTTIKQAHDVFVLGRFACTFGSVILPILLGDIIAYSLGRRHGLGLRERIPLLRRLITDSRLGRVQRWFDHYGPFTVFLGRQVAGVRFVTFFTAGSMRVPLPKFVAFDFLGCLVTVPLWLTLGVLASRYGEVWLRVAVHRVGNGLLIGAVLVFAVFLLVVKLRQAHVMAKPAVKTSEHAE